MPALERIPLDAIRAAQSRIADLALRTPLIPLAIDAPGAVGADIRLKLENLQPIGSFKLRGAGNAMRSLPPEALAGGVHTASAGNMGQGVAYIARRLDVPCTVIVPDHAPSTKLRAIERFDAAIVKVPFDTWWEIITTHRFDGGSGHFVHPVSDPAVVAGNGTIGLEILEDLESVDAIVIPFGGGGLSCGIASAVRALSPKTRIYAAEVETAAPLRAALAAGTPQRIDYTASFVDGIGGRTVLPEMWPRVRELIDDAIVVSLDEVEAAVRGLAVRNSVIAEGAGAAAVAAALSGKAGGGKIVCVVSGGNIDDEVLARILRQT